MWARLWQEEQWNQCPGCGTPRDEAWVEKPEDELEFRAKWRGTSRLCVPCDETARVRKEHEKQESAYAGGVNFFPVRRDSDAV